MNEHTPGPYRGCGLVVAEVFIDNHHREVSEDEANARLVAAAPDHAVVAWAVCAGAARWEQWEGSGYHGEFCIGGLRHSTRLDEFGVPILTNGIRAAIAKAREPVPATTGATDDDA